MKSSDILPREVKSLTQSGKLSVKKRPQARFSELHQDYVCSAAYRTDFSPIDTVKMAESCGVAGLRTTDPAELAAAAKAAIAGRRSLVIAVPVSYTDYRLF